MCGGFKKLSLGSAGLWVKVNEDLSLSKHTVGSRTFWSAIMGDPLTFRLSPLRSQSPCPGTTLGLYMFAVFCSISVYGKVSSAWRVGVGMTWHLVFGV